MPPSPAAPGTALHAAVRGGAAVAAAVLALSAAPLAGTALAADLSLLSTSPSDGATAGSTTAVTATYDQALASSSTLTVTRGSSTTASCTSSVSGSTLSCTSGLGALRDGSYRAVATARTAGGQMRTDSFGFTVDTVAPATPTVAFPAPALGRDTSAATTLTGTGEAGTRLVVTVRDGSGATVRPEALTVPAGGSWSLPGLDLSALADGTLTATARLTDAAGNSSGSGTATATKDTTGPALVAHAPDPAAPRTTGGAPTPVTATFGEALADGWTLEVAREGNPNPRAGTTTLSGDRRTLTFVPSSALGDGRYTASADVTDALGNASSTGFAFTTDSVPPAAPTVVLPAYVGSADQAAARVTGTGEPGTTVTVTTADTSALTADVTTGTTVGGDGTYVLTQDLRGLRQGALSATAVSRDTAGNTSATSATATATKDTTAPSVSSATVSPGTVGAAGTTVTVSVAVKASAATGAGAEPGAEVRVDAEDGDPAHAVHARTTTGPDGTVGVPVDVTPLSDGAVTVRVTALDAAANPSAPVTRTVTKDTGAPAAPAVSAPAYAAAGTAAAWPLSGTAEPGTTVQVGVADDAAVSRSPAGTVTAGAGGAWSTTVDVRDLREGSVLIVSAAARDAAGNTGPTATTTAVKDTTAPAAPGAVSVPVVKAATRTAAPVGGTAEPGATVTVAVDDADPLTSPATTTATAAGDGAWAAAVDVSGLSDGSLTASATARDAAGNTGPAATAAGRKDTVAPGLPTVSGSSPDPVRQDDAVTVSGSLAAGDTAGSADLKVTVYLDDEDPATPTLTATTSTFSSGAWSATFGKAAVAGLTDGVLSARARVQDSAGNGSGQTAATTSTKNATRLQLVSSTPADSGTTGPKRLLSATFDEPLQQTGTGASTIALADRDGAVACTPSSPDERTIACTPGGRQGLSEAGNPYTLTVTARDRVGETLVVPVTFTVDATGPLVSGLTATASTHDSPLSTVSGSLDDATGTVALSATSPGSTAPVTGTATADGSGAFSTGLDLSSLVPGTVTVTARATDPLGNRGAAASTTTARTDRPAAPAAPVAVAGDREATVSWTAPTDDGGTPVTGYDVAPVGAPGLAVSVGPELRTATVPGLVNGTAYAFTVTARNADGGTTSAPGAEVTPRATTRTSLTLSRTTAVYGDGVRLGGRLTRSDRLAPAPGAQVRVVGTSADGTKRYWVLDTDGSTGTYAVDVTARRDESFRAYWAGDTATTGSASPARTLAVAPRTTLAVAATGAAGPTPVRGAVQPGPAGTTVTVSALGGDAPQVLGTAALDADGRYRLEVTLPAGTTTLVATVPATADNAAGSSPAVTVTRG